MDWTVIRDAWPALAAGLAQTLTLCALAAALALLLGMAVAGARMQRHRWLARVADVYTAVCLGLPLLIVIFLLFYVLPEAGITLSPHTVGVLALTLYYAPYFAQVMVAALRTLPGGQRDAATALGLPWWRTVRRVWLPHALPVMLPPVTGLLIGLLKDSALLAMVSVPELMFAARQAISETYAPLEIYLVVALVYWLMSLIAEGASGYVEHRLTAYRRPTTKEALLP